MLYHCLLSDSNEDLPEDLRGFFAGFFLNIINFARIISEAPMGGAGARSVSFAC